MAIKTVTQANLADHVAEKRAQGANISTQEQVAAIAVQAAAKPQEKPAEGDSKSESRIVATGEEKLEGAAPEPQGTPQPTQKQGKKNPVQDRIDELTREKRELEEFAEGEYTGRISAQRRIQELEGQLTALQPKPQEKVEEDPAPDPEKYTDQKKYLDDRDAWNRRQAIREFRQDQTRQDQEKEQQRLLAEANERKANSVKAARETFKDFDEVIRRADQQVSLHQLPAPPMYIQAVLQESDYSAHLLYHFASNPEEAKRIFALRPAKAAMELGRLETQFAKGEAKANPTTTAPAQASQPQAQGAPQTSRAPPPMPSLNAGPGDVPWDASQPQAFMDYKRKRIDEIRRKRGH